MVLRGLHHSTNIEEIKKEIHQLGHTVSNINNVKQRITAKPLPLFYVDLKPTSNNKEIYSITSLMHTKIKFEAPNPKKEIPQCTRCQRYDHTKKFCHRHPRCVKCAADHHTKDCSRNSKDSNVKCALCSGNHPANYKGCSYYQEIRKKKFPEQRKREFSQITKVINNHPASSQNMENKNIQGVINPAVYIYQASDFPQLKQQQQETISPIIAPQPTNDMCELKQMMKALMEQMSTMLNLLTTLVAKMA